MGLGDASRSGRRSSSSPCSGDPTLTSRPVSWSPPERSPCWPCSRPCRWAGRRIPAPGSSMSFASPPISGSSCSPDMLLRPGSGRPLLAGIAAGLVVVSGSRRLAAPRPRRRGRGPRRVLPLLRGRLSYPIGYWNALGAMAAMAVPLLVWLGASARRPAIGLMLACFVPGPARQLHDLLARRPDRRRPRRRGRDRGQLRSRALVRDAAGRDGRRGPGGRRGNACGPASSTSRGRASAGPSSSSAAPSPSASLFAAAAGPAAVERLGSVRVPGLRMRHVVAAALVVLAMLVVIVGPGEVAGDFAAKEGRQSTGSGGATLSVSGSGRAQFWGAALDAFAAEPAKGIGAGGYETWWNRNGTLETPAQNAHSEPLELLAELGPLGLLAFLAFFGIVGFAGVRTGSPSRTAPRPVPPWVCWRRRPVGLLIDWTWDLPGRDAPGPRRRGGALLARPRTDREGMLPSVERRLDRVVARARAGTRDSSPSSSPSRPPGPAASSPPRRTGSTRAMTPSPAGQLNDAAQAAQVGGFGPAAGRRHHGCSWRRSSRRPATSTPPGAPSPRRSTARRTISAPGCWPPTSRRSSATRTPSGRMAARPWSWRRWCFPARRSSRSRA